MAPFIDSKTTNIVFTEVVLRFTRQIYYDDEDTFQLEVRKSPEPLPGGAFQADVETRLEQLQQVLTDHVAINQFFYRFKIPPGESPQERELAALGDQLYKLLPKSFREAFMRLVQTVFEKGQGIRLTLEARAGDKADQLLSLPWETLFFKETGIYFARTPRVLILRRLLNAARRSPVQMKAPFGVCHIIAHTPASAKEYWIDKTLQKAEIEAIQQAAGPGYYQPVKQPGSVEQLLAALREKHYHIVHFLGHGELQQIADVNVSRKEPDRGYLRFVDVDGKSQWITGEQLQHLLSFTPAVQLVVLNACHGGSGAAGSIALELVYNGLPYVVAMQNDILQDAARYFSSAFYTELQRGQPVEYAVAVGRSAIAINMPNTSDWCLPVLYTGAGVPEQTALPKMADRLWQWASHPKALQWMKRGNITFGLLQFLVGALLLLSNVSPPPPVIPAPIWVSGGLALAPLVITAITYWGRQVPIPSSWSFSTRASLILRSLGGASTGFGLPVLYVWFLLLLLAGLGFWELLSSPAQLVLLGILLIPALMNGYAQLAGHGRAFINNAQVELPPFQWGEIFVIIAGYGIIFAPLALFELTPRFLTLPQANLALGAFLTGLGYLLPVGGQITSLAVKNKEN